MPAGRSTDAQVRVRVTEDRVVFQPAADSEMSDNPSPDQSNAVIPTPAKVPAQSSPKQNRTRLKSTREIMEMGEARSLEPQQPRRAKSPRNDKEGIELAVSHLESLKSEAEIERDRVDRKILALALNGVDVTEVFSPPRWSRWP